MTNAHISLTHAIRVLARQAENLTATALEPLDITPLQYDILESVALYMEHPDGRTLMPARTSRFVQAHHSTGNDHLLALKKRGYVRIAVGGARLLTTQGTELLQQCRTALEDANGVMYHYFSPPYHHGPAAITGAYLKQRREADI